MAQGALRLAPGVGHDLAPQHFLWIGLGLGHWLFLPAHLDAHSFLHELAQGLPPGHRARRAGNHDDQGAARAHPDDAHLLRNTLGQRVGQDHDADVGPTDRLVEKLGATMEAQPPTAEGGTGAAWLNN
jgi:hypothetical protein